MQKLFPYSLMAVLFFTHCSYVFAEDTLRCAWEVRTNAAKDFGNSDNFYSADDRFNFNIELEAVRSLSPSVDHDNYYSVSRCLKRSEMRVKKPRRFPKSICINVFGHPAINNASGASLRFTVSLEYAYIPVRKDNFHKNGQASILLPLEANPIELEIRPPTPRRSLLDSVELKCLPATEIETFNQ